MEYTKRVCIFLPRKPLIISYFLPFLHFFRAFKENLGNFKRPYVKRGEPVLGMYPYIYTPLQGLDTGVVTI